MLHRRQISEASRRFQAASSELRDEASAAEATFRMACLWTWGFELDRPLDLDELQEAIASFQARYADGRQRRLEPDWPSSQGANG